MKYRVISTCDVPVPVNFGNGQDFVLVRRGDSAEVDINPSAAIRIAAPGAVRFERIEEPAPVVERITKSEPKPARAKAAAPEAQAAADPATTHKETDQ